MQYMTYSCHYIAGNDRGVLYWLGTGKGTQEYRNPVSIGAISVHVGKLGDITPDEREHLLQTQGETARIRDEAFSPESRQALVQYQPPVKGYDEDTMLYHHTALEQCFSLWCNMSLCNIPTIVDLQFISLRLTAYSLRFDRHGMTDWNFEGSTDGIEWTLLHEARNDRHLAALSSDLQMRWQEDMDACSSTEEAVVATQEFVERELRHTWEITSRSDVFHRYFRITGSGTNYERTQDSYTCLHGVGLELYGDIHDDFVYEN